MACFYDKRYKALTMGIHMAKIHILVKTERNMEGEFVKIERKNGPYFDKIERYSYEIAGCLSFL